MVREEDGSPRPGKDCCKHCDRSGSYRLAGHTSCVTVYTTMPCSFAPNNMYAGTRTLEAHMGKGRGTGGMPNCP